ncbi:hypothetical protein ACFWXK_15605 [Streptomyces sp. NPDC059070]|uniref:hypothetical protein n=1 Tax=Streptomyces sp. NPDC059070 TaxID=3346713 RepID=UPI0036A9E663
MFSSIALHRQTRNSVAALVAAFCIAGAVAGPASAAQPADGPRITIYTSNEDDCRSAAFNEILFLAVSFEYDNATHLCTIIGEG